MKTEAHVYTIDGKPVSAQAFAELKKTLAVSAKPELQGYRTPTKDAAGKVTGDGILQRFTATSKDGKNYHYLYETLDGAITESLVLLKAEGPAESVLGENVPAKQVLADRNASPCAKTPDLKVTADRALHIDSAHQPQFVLRLQNVSKKNVAACLLPFSVISSPLVLLTLKSPAGQNLQERLPEVYPSGSEKVAFTTFTVEAQTTVIVRQSFVQNPGPIANGTILEWAAWLNGEYVKGSETL